MIVSTRLLDAKVEEADNNTLFQKAEGPIEALCYVEVLFVGCYELVEFFAIFVNDSKDTPEKGY